MGAVLGIDGGRAGWVGAHLADDNSLTLHLAAALQVLVLEAGDVDTAVVDMPVTLLASARRPLDGTARRLLGPRRSSIFPAPPLGALRFADDQYADANAWAKETYGHGISKQAWYLVPRIREVLAWQEHGRTPSLHECSPELSFAALAGGEPLAHPKSTWAGLARRIELLRDAGIDIPAHVGDAGRAGPDDVVDAVALAWSARRIRDGKAERAPLDAPPEHTIRW